MSLWGLACAIVLGLAGPGKATGAEAMPAPSSLELQDLEGTRHSLANYRGRVVMVNFWGTWCPPCVEELPALARLAADFRGRSFAILGVTVREEPTDLRRFLERMPVAFPTLLDRDGEELQEWRVRVFPTTFLIGPDGLVHEELVGPRDWDDPYFRSFIQALLPDLPAESTAP